MSEKKIDQSGKKPADKPAELSDADVEQVAGGAKAATIYDKKGGVKFE